MEFGSKIKTHSKSIKMDIESKSVFIGFLEFEKVPKLPIFEQIWLNFGLKKVILW